MKKAIKLFAFILCVVVAIFVITKNFTYPNKPVHDFLKDFKNADVLVLGSSHAYCNINAATLWNEYGIPAVSICQGEQPLSYSYYMLESAIKHHKPKVVVFEIYMSVWGEATDFDTKLEQYISALYGFPLTSNFFSRAKASKQIKNDFLSSVFGFFLWSKSAGNWLYKYDEKNNAGFAYVFNYDKNLQWQSRSSTNKYTKISALSDYSNDAIKKTYDLCQKNGIELVFLLTPYQAPDEHIAHINAIKQFAKDNSIAFLDMNNYVEEIDIDLSYEMSDFCHALISGANKNSRFLAKYLINNFALSSKKENSAYANWDKVYADYVIDMQNNLQNLNLSNFLRLIAKEGTIQYQISMPKNITNILIDKKMGELFYALFDVKLEKNTAYTICNGTNFLPQSTDCRVKPDNDIVCSCTVFSPQTTQEDCLLINYSFNKQSFCRVWYNQDLQNLLN